MEFPEEPSCLRTLTQSETKNWRYKVACGNEKGLAVSNRLNLDVGEPKHLAADLVFTSKPVVLCCDETCSFKLTAATVGLTQAFTNRSFFVQIYCGLKANTFRALQ
jgi:hypothetical protein